MAKQVVTVLTDDLDGKEIPQGEGETVTFALDGTTYELDLSTKNADKFRESFQEWIGAGRKVSAGKSAGRKATKASGGSGRSSEELQEIRAWARDNGYDVPERGRIKQEVLDAYDAS